MYSLNKYLVRVIYAYMILILSSPESLNLYFSRYGEITNCVIMYDKTTGRPRGFGFVTFADPEVAEKVLEENHVIDGRAVRIILHNSARYQDFVFDGFQNSYLHLGCQVEVKRTVPRENVQVRGGGGGSGTKKIFVGGLPVALTEGITYYCSVIFYSLSYDKYHFSI